MLQVHFLPHFITDQIVVHSKRHCLVLLGNNMFCQSNYLLTQYNRLSANRFIIFRLTQTKFRLQQFLMISIKDDASETAFQLRKCFCAHLIESNTIITKIKESVYQIVKMNIGIFQSSQNLASMGAILQSGQQNIDNLRRIQSILRGFANSEVEKQEQQTRLLEQNQRQNNEYYSINKFSLEKIDKKSLQHIRNKSKNPKKELLLKPNQKKLEDLNTLQLQSKLKPEFQDNRSQTLPEEHSPNSLIIKQLQIQIQYLRKENHQLRQQISSFDSKLSKNQMLFSFGKPSQTIISQNMNGNPSELRRCREEIKSSSSRIREVSTRNKECLQLLKTVKDQLYKKKLKKSEQRSVKKSEGNQLKHKKSKILL